ncbi:MAG: hypothetical protein ACXU7O_13430, partial [Croceibacterium sp.]
MSNAEYLSRPFPLLAKLAALLRNIAPVRKAFARFGILLQSSKKSDEPLVSEFVGEIPDVTDEIPDIIDETLGVTDEATETADETPRVTDRAPEVADEAPDSADETSAVADEVPAIIDEIPEVSETSEPPVIAPVVSAEVPPAPVCSLSLREQLIRRRWAETGIKMWAGQGALNIQGSAELLPAEPGGTRREYDRL